MSDNNPGGDWAQRIGRHIRPDGSVAVPPRIAAWLESKAGITADRRINLRVSDPEAYEVLAALHLAALSYGSDDGTKPAVSQGTAPELTMWVTTSHAAAQLGITDRAVRKRIDTGRLPATRCGNRWMIHAHHLKAITIAA